MGCCPPQSHALRLVTPRPSRNGWEERQVFDYETSPNERAVVQAIASRTGKSWTVVLLDGSEPTFEKRSAPINLLIGACVRRDISANRLSGASPIF